MLKGTLQPKHIHCVMYTGGPEWAEHDTGNK